MKFGVETTGELTLITIIWLFLSIGLSMLPGVNILMSNKYRIIRWGTEMNSNGYYIY